MAGYQSSQEHLLEELRRIDLMIRLQVLRLRLQGPAAMDDFRGLYIKEEEIDILLAEQAPFEAERRIDSPQLRPLLDQLDVLQTGIAAKKAMTLRAGMELRLERLKERFQLSPFDVDALLICLAPELDLKYEKLYAYLQDDVTKRRPGVDLVLAMLCPTFQTRLAAREHFAAAAPLIWHRLLNLFTDTPERHPPLLAYLLKVDERIVQYLLGSDQPDTRLSPLLRSPEARMSWGELLLPEDIKTHLEQLLEWYCEPKPHDPPGHGLSEEMILYMQGGARAGKWTTAEALAGEFGIPLLVIDTARLLQGDLAVETMARLICREAVLQQAALYFDRFDVLLGEDEKIKQYRETMIEELERFSGLIFLAGQVDWEPAGAFQRKVFIRIELPVPPYALRKQLWAMSLNGRAPADLDLDALADKFRLGAGQIRDAVAMARNLAHWRDPAHGDIGVDDLYTACRAHSNQKLSTLALKVQPKFTWSDIVLPKEQIAQLREIVNAVKYRHLVYGDWGFERKLSLGKGLNILFAGTSGTGKTMAAEIIAHEWALDLYKIDLSQVVSKYIGETEKNLDRVFHEAQTSNAVLFFDEADALFGKRSEVKDAHDRYANIEIGYLLQKMEEYEGVAILATNWRANLDEAFARRLQFVVEFPFPDEEYRYHIWRGMFPPQAPLVEDVDFARLARAFKLSGGNIKNIAITAAFLAADEGQPIGMGHLLRAAKREFQKVGQAWEESEWR
jgi:Winged helix domain, variant/ATPase family associated with various cellular activities (AAA)